VQKRPPQRICTQAAEPPREHSRERLCSATKPRASSISETCHAPSTKELQSGCRASHREHSREHVCSATKSRAFSRERSQERLNSATKHRNSSGSLYFADLVRRRQMQLAATSSAKNGADKCPRRSSELHTIRHRLTAPISGLETTELKDLRVFRSLVQSPSPVLIIFYESQQPCACSSSLCLSPVTVVTELQARLPCRETLSDALGVRCYILINDFFYYGYKSENSNVRA